MMKPIQNQFWRRWSSGPLSFLLLLSWLAAIQPLTAQRPCSLTCGGALNLSVDEFCMGTFGLDPDFGDQSCPDHGVFVIEFKDADGNILPNPFDATNYLGQTITYKITDPVSLQNCWGDMLVEDKWLPNLECGTYDYPCNLESFEPGAPIAPLQMTTNYLLTGQATTDGGVVFETFNPGLPPGAVIENVEVFLDIEHSSVGELSAALGSPNNSIRLFVQPGTPQGSCDGDNLQVKFDKAGIPHVQFQAACNNQPAIGGVYQPQGDLTTLGGIGNWQLTVAENLGDGITGTIRSAYVKISYRTNGLTIPFPLPPGTIILPPSGTGPFMLPGFDNCGDATLSYTDREEIQPMCGNVIKIIYRDWVLRDEQGNEKTCTDIINVTQVGLGGLTQLPDYDDRDLPALRCEDRETPPVGFFIIPKIGWNAIDPGDLPHDDYVGHPSPYDEFYPAPNGNIVKWYGTGTPLPVNSCCTNISYTFTDTRLNHCPAPSTSDGCFKIVREWLILEWCSGAIERQTQIIKVKDDRAPQMTGLADLTISTKLFDCKAEWLATVPNITDNCSDIEDYIVSTPGGNAQFDSGLGLWKITGLMIGTHVVTYSVKDCCGNQRITTINLTVEDRADPLLVCKPNLTPQLTAAGNIRLDAGTFDDGSSDACGDVFFKAIRMDNLLGTIHGSTADQTGTDCGSFNADDDPATVLTMQIWFDDFVWFCCEDVGKTDLMVVLRVFDAQPPPGPIDPALMQDGVLKDVAGNKIANFADCMIPVTVIDKESPRITCPADERIECTDDFDMLLTNAISPTPPGSPVFLVTLNGPGDADNDTSALAIGYYTNVVDVCGTNTVYVFDKGHINECGISVVSETDDTPAPILRCWVVVDEMGRFDACTQTINVVNSTPFNGSDITWPADFNVQVSMGNCDPSIDKNDLLPSQIPQYTNDECAKLLETPRDMVFERDDFVMPPPPGLCKKVLREWEVVDWCQRQLPPWISPTKQAIYFIDSEGPTVICTIANTPPITVGANGLATVTIDATVTDNCETTFDATNVANQIKLEDGTIINGTGIQIVHDFPAGTHTVCFTATDNCGLTGSCTTTVEVMRDECGLVDDFIPISLGSNLPVTLAVGDVYTGSIATAKLMIEGKGTDTSFDFNCSDIQYNMKYPTEYNGMVIFPGTGIPPCKFLVTVQDVEGPDAGVCMNISPVVLNNVNGVDQATINISQIRSGIETDNCTDPADLIISFDQLFFSPPINGGGLPTGKQDTTVTCADLDANGELILTVYVYDLTGQGGDCNVTLKFKNSAGTNCPVALPPFNISGNIQRDDGEAVEDVMVHLAGGMTMDKMTDENGEFAFEDLPAGYNYSLLPEKNDDPLNGISTFDLVLMSKHILGAQPLSSPYRMIAADVNRSGTITTFDIIELRKLILLINDRFPQNTSWRFIDANFLFPNSDNPFETSFPEVYNINSLSDSERAGFIAVKTGDVNGSAQLGNLQPSSGRSYKGVLNLEVADQLLQAGKSYTIDFVNQEALDLLGMQFTLGFDKEKIELIDISGEALLNANNFGQRLLPEGVLTASWNEAEPTDLDVGEPVFSLHFRANHTAWLSELIQLNTQHTPTEAYRADEAMLDIQLAFTSEERIMEQGFRLYQNQPNPFRQETLISFWLPKAGEASLQIYDISGKLIWSRTDYYEQGYQEHYLNRTDLNTNGVLYYQLKTDQHTAVKKMTIIE